MAMQMVPRDLWWTKPIPREAWRLVLAAEQPFLENSPEGRKTGKLITPSAEGYGQMVYARTKLSRREMD